MFFEILGWVGRVVGFLVLVFLIATSLYYISEVLEERTVLAKRYITRYIQFVIVCHVVLWLFDGLPLWPTLWSLATNSVYLMVMKSFPVVELSSPMFIAACFGAMSSHFLWFWHFTSDDLPPHVIYDTIPNYSGKTLPPFSEIASFFGLLVWTIPFVLFLSLSANDNVLPTVNESSQAKPRKGLARQFLENLYNWCCETLVALGLKENKSAALLM